MTEIRKTFWSSSRAPFEDTEEGRQAAVDWFQRKVDDYNAQGLGKHRPARFMMTFEIDVNSYYDFESHLGEMTKKHIVLDDDGTISGGYEALAAAIVESREKGLGEVSQVSWKAQRFYLELTNRLGFTKRFIAPQNSVLFTLHQSVENLNKLVTWCTKKDIVEYIVYNRLPGAGIKTTIELQEGNSVTMRLPHPVAVEELVETYLKLFNAAKVKKRGMPKKLTVQDQVLLKLLHETPDASWVERHQIWQKRASEEGLTPYRDYRALAQAVSRAARKGRVGWGSLM